jgi:hypothetical protein
MPFRVCVLCHSKRDLCRGALTQGPNTCNHADARARGGLPTPRGGCRRGVFGHTLGVKVVLSFERAATSWNQARLRKRTSLRGWPKAALRHGAAQRRPCRRRSMLRLCSLQRGRSMGRVASIGEGHGDDGGQVIIFVGVVPHMLATWYWRDPQRGVILVGEAALCIIRTTRRRPSMEALSIIMVSEVRPGPGPPPKSAPLHVLGMSSSVPSSARSKAAWGRRLRGEREAGRPGAPPHEDGTESRLRPPKHQPFSCLAARVRRACRERVRAASRLALTCVLTLLPHPRPSSSSLEESGSTGAAV